MFYRIKPIAPAQLGKNTKFDESVVPWKVKELHLVFDLYSEDDILRESPAYYVTAPLYKSISESDLSGIELGNKVKAEASDTFKNLYPDQELPVYYLITIVGEPNKDDFGIASPNKLIVSDSALELLQQHNMESVEIIELT